MNKFVVFLAQTAKALIRPFFPLTVYGDSTIPDTRCIASGNHISAWDPFMFSLCRRKIISSLYKAEFAENRFLRWLLDGLECIPVRRGEADINGTKQILRLLKSDKGLIIAPEGTRNPYVDCFQEFHTGAALFAIKTRTPIKPYYIWDKAKAFHRNYIIYGDLFTLEQFYDKPLNHQTLEEATAFIREKLDGLRIQLNAILAEKGVKRRKRTKKELKKIAEFESRKAIAEQQAEANTEQLEAQAQSEVQEEAQAQAAATTANEQPQADTTANEE